MKLLAPVLFLLVGFFIAPASSQIFVAAAPARESRLSDHFESAHFIIHAPPPGVSGMAFYAKMCEEALKRITSGSRFSFPKKIQVRISPSAKDFQEVSRLQSHTTMAVAFPEQGYMVLNIEGLQRANPSERLQVVGHELVHLILGQIADDEAHVPAWFHEGMAQLLAGQYDLDRSIRLAWANAIRQRIPMTELIGAFPYSTNQSELAYAQSASFAMHVCKEELHFDNPEHLFQDLLRDPEKAKTLFARLSDKDIVAEMENNWTGGQIGPRNWLLILTSGGIIWGIITVLFLTAYYHKKRSQQAIIQEWDPWERENENHDDLDIVENADNEDDHDTNWRH